MTNIPSVVDLTYVPYGTVQAFFYLILSDQDLLQ